jgi:hypothetical protein
MATLKNQRIKSICIGEPVMARLSTRNKSPKHKRWLGLAVLALSPFAAVNMVWASAASPDVVEAFGGNGVPITVGQFEDVDAIGYEEREYFVAGGAHKFAVDTKLSKDGKWDAIRIEAASRPYKTRVVVYTPTDPARFNGTVYIEWQNNSGMVDAAPDWVHGHVEVARQGAAYVLVSAQPIGIATLKAKDPWWVPAEGVSFAVSDPERYGSLTHPGNRYSFDIFSQVAQAVHDGNLLGGLTAERLVGLGESQSASWLTSYINGVQKLADLFDGFVVHSSFGLGVGVASPAGNAGVTHIRDDLVPVLLFQSETDVQLGANFTRQAETADGKFRLWEIAGAAHYDTYGLVSGIPDTGDGQAEVAALQSLRNPEMQAQGGLMSCARGINAGPMHWVYGAALNWINRWIIDGTAPPIAPRLETEANPLVVMFRRDEHGIALGGVRTPFVDAPLAMLTGFGNEAAEGASFISSFCFIFGQTVPFDEQKLTSLYGSNEGFVEKFREATEQAVQAGFLLRPDADNLIEAAEGFDLGL